MHINIISVGSLLIMLTSCATFTEIVPAGKDTYIVSGHDELTSGRNVKAELYKKAYAHCENMGKKVLPLNESVSIYSSELRFRCLLESDPEYVRPIMETVPN